MSLYRVSFGAYSISVSLLTILAFIQPFQAVGVVMVVGGAARAGGDVRTNLLLDSGLICGPWPSPWAFWAASYSIGPPPWYSSACGATTL